MDAESEQLADGLTLGDIESAHSSARLFANIASDKKRRQFRRPT